MAGFYYKDPAAPKPNRPRAVSVAALIERDGALLLDGRRDPPGWGLPAGRLEDDESVADALRRELREETGLEPTHVDLFGVFSDSSRIVRYADGNTYGMVTIAFTVEVADFAPLRPSVESTDVRFFALDELPDDLISTHRPIVERFVSRAAPPFVD